jgi:hypothetical protein
MRALIFMAVMWMVPWVQAAPAMRAPAVDPVYAPLWLYQGTWQVSRSDLAAGGKPDELKNQCALLGKYFACQQTINGQQGALVIFIPASGAGQYYTQFVRLEGVASGRGNLEIAGDRWTYTSTRDASGETLYYRTINVFTGKNRIHFESAESGDGKNWKVTGSGDEVRVGAEARKR